MRSFNFQEFTNREPFPKPKAMKPLKGHIIAFLATGVAFAIAFYVGLPPISIRTSESAFFLVAMLVIFCVIDYFLTFRFGKLLKVVGGAAILLAAFVIVMSFFSAPIFRSSAYREQLKISESESFESEFDTISLDQIPVIDLSAARQLGDKKLGTVSGLGSQFDVSDEYTLISVKDELYRVSPLEYQDVYKWFQNRNDGIPGFIKVNVTDPNDVELVQLEEGMIYSPSAYLNQNLERLVRLRYPTELMQDYSFELDDDGKPYWVISTYLPSIGLYGGNDANGVIIVDPVNGDMEKYSIEDAPEWVDRIQPADIAMNQLNNWGLYVNGFFNTLFGQKDMLSLTETYNYITINGQTHVFTGMTSTGGDHSINGFALINLKTKEAKFFQVNGADEVSAKQSAEGEVQHLGYIATDPLILNIAGKPTYFVSLKDQAGLVKKFGFVSLENYSIVGIGDTVSEAQTAYVKKLKEGGITIDKDTNLKELKGPIKQIATAIQDGTSSYYITIEGSEKLFIVPISLSAELPLSKAGESVTIKYLDSEDNRVIADSFDNNDLNYE